MGGQLSGQCCVAIIGDDEAVRHSTVGPLKRADYRVVLFTDGAEFLASGLTEDLCCILLDMRMLGMDGLSVMRALCEREVTVPILVITGDGDIPLAVEAMRLGAIDFLEKPYAPAALLDAILRACTPAPVTAILP